MARAQHPTLRMRIVHGWLSMLRTALVLTLPFATAFADTRPDEVKPTESANCEHAGCPQVVCQLFYAVKDSLDHGGVENRIPQKRLVDYRRVSKEVLRRFNAEFTVVSYRSSSEDYELIVANRSIPAVKYRATRYAKFRWEDGKWASLGGYLYF